MLNRQAELDYYKISQRRNNESRSEWPDFDIVYKRPIQVAFEAFSSRPQDIFYFRLNQHRFVGRKTLSPLGLEKRITGTKCSRITTNMIFGVIERDQITEKGIILSYRPLLPAEKAAIFDKLKTTLETDLYFPYPYLNTSHNEDISPTEFWTPTAEQVSSLNAGEEHIRQFTQRFLTQFDLNGKKIYDPACSTGQFLSHIKRNFPTAYCIGQDLNSQMVDYAREHGCLDELQNGSAEKNTLNDESLDFIFFRFLNLEVVDTKTAHELFCRIANKCKNGGHIIVLGHTPILISKEWFLKLGMEVLQCLGCDENSVFQYYIIKKTGPVPLLQYEDMGLLETLIQDNKVQQPNQNRLFSNNDKTPSPGSTKVSTNRFE